MSPKMNSKALREARGWSQRELGEKVGVSDVSVCHWENGRKFPSARTLLLLCAAFDCSMNDLFVRE